MIEISHKLMQSSKAIQHIFDVHNAGVVLFAVSLVDYTHYGDTEGEVIGMDVYIIQGLTADWVVESDASCIDIPLSVCNCTLRTKDRETKMVSISRSCFHGIMWLGH
jgi:hypothetical protein